MAEIKKLTVSALEVYCDLLAEPEARNEQLNKIAPLVSTGADLHAVVECSGEYIAHADNAVRNKATMFLVDILSKRSDLRLQAAQTDVLAVFFSERLADRPCLKEILRGLEILVHQHRLVGAQLPRRIVKS